MITDYALFLIESGRPLELVRAHIADVKRLNRENCAIARKLGATKFTSYRDDGRIAGIVFDGPIHTDFKAPKKDGVSYPRKGSAWAERFADQIGYQSPEITIQDAFKVPVSISYSHPNGTYGESMIGLPFQSCGFLYCSAEGPYAMWIPDVEAAVSKYEAKGYEVDAAIKAFRMAFDGARRILKEEWDLICAQHELAAKQAEAA